MRFLLLFFISCSNFSPILIDGKAQEYEWEDAKLIKIDSDNRLFIKSDSQYYYLLVQSDLAKPWYIDLYVYENNNWNNFHVSSQLGHRLFTDSTWTDSKPRTAWGETKAWYANEIRFDRFLFSQLQADSTFNGNYYEKTIIPYDGIELQFDRKVYTDPKWKLRLEIRNAIGPNSFKKVVYPMNSNRKNIQSYKEINFKE